MTDSETPAFLFDLDGTLLDSVYQHVIAWQRAFADVDIDPALWLVHRRIGMSGSLVAARVASESGRVLTDAEVERVESLHGAHYEQMLERRSDRFLVRATCCWHCPAPTLPGRSRRAAAVPRRMRWWPSSTSAWSRPSSAMTT